MQWHIFKVSNCRLLSFFQILSLGDAACLIYPLHRLKLNTKTQNIFFRLNENLTTFLCTLTGATREQKEKKKFSLLKCIQKSNVIKI